MPDLPKRTEFQPVDLIGLLRAEMKKHASAADAPESVVWTFIEPAGGDVWVNGDTRLIRHLVGTVFEELRPHARSKIEMRLDGHGADGTYLVIQDDRPAATTKSFGLEAAVIHSISELHGWSLKTDIWQKDGAAAGARVAFRMRRIYTETKQRKAR